MMSNTVKYVAEHMGVEVIANWRLPNLAFTRRLQDLFAHFSITSVIDVGANAGQFRDQMRNEVGFRGPIYSFEPDPALAAALARRAAMDAAWTVFPMALGATAGVVAFNIMENPVYNSFRLPSAEASAHCANGNLVVQAVDVTVQTLDAVAANFPDLAHTYLKVDTQGFDLEVLKGGQFVASQVPVLQTEVSLRQLYRDGPSMQDSIAAFNTLGFAIADMFLVSTDGEHRAVEFDCIMVQERRLARRTDFPDNISPD